MSCSHPILAGVGLFSLPRVLSGSIAACSMKKNGQFHVFEAVQPVKSTPLETVYELL